MMPRQNTLHLGGFMRRRAIATLLTAACLALVGCSSSDSDKPEPAKSKPAATSSARAELSVADQIKACTCSGRR
ncbi:hypothetical protein [Streptomyces sp. NPDC088812]|uniref:hypothetical protein n=1 Tax=Streptomyces sp. NPDC088812 TaxID=3365905 RepID=UPI0038072315